MKDDLKVHIVTGNKNKLESARKRLEPFRITVEQIKLEIIEPQSEDIKFVAEFKATQAFEKVGKPVLVSDTGWSIPALKGFPGPLMHYMTDWFEAEDFLNLMKGKEDRTIIIENIATYKDKDQIKTFTSKRIGKILFEAKGIGAPIDKVATFRSDNKTIGECMELGISSFDEELTDSIWTQFGEWYSTNINQA